MSMVCITIYTKVVLTSACLFVRVQAVAVLAVAVVGSWGIGAALLALGKV